MKKFYLAAILTLLSCLSVYADQFIVTSNADAGPGTLREALDKAAANGTTDMDFIYFRMLDVSEAGRTISLLTELPPLSSHLSIDGVSQPGAPFGISNAKVKIRPANNNSGITNGLRIINMHTIEIFGLYITGFNKNNNNGTGCGIYIKGSTNIYIGYPTSGNIINNCTNLIYQELDHSIFPTNLISIKSNLLGFYEDGKTIFSYSPTEYWISGISLYGDQITIGGESQKEGNLIGASTYLGYNVLGDNLKNEDIKIINNIVGTDFTESIKFPYMRSGLQIHSRSNIEIKRNTIANYDRWGIYLNDSKDFKITGNRIGTNSSENKNLGGGENTVGNNIVVYIEDSQNGIIGGENPGEGNTIAYNNRANPNFYSQTIECIRSAKITLSRNKIFCNSTGNTYPYYNPYTVLPEVYIETISGNSVTGRATPNSKVELFYTDRCGMCEPETYFATVQANVAGKWSYLGPLNGSVVASATINGSTSEFTKVEINSANVIVNPDNCNQGIGSIKGIKIKNTSAVKWLDASGNVVGTGPDLENVKAGKYTIVTEDGCAKSQTFEVLPSTSIKLHPESTRIQHPCGIYKGSIGLGIIHSGSFHFTWRDKAGNIILESDNTTEIWDLGPGEYTATISDRLNCSITAGPFILTQQPGPSIDETNIKITYTDCEEGLATISNLKVSGTVGNTTYAWKNENGLKVSSIIDFPPNIPGKYQLFVKDESSCGQISSSVFTIEPPITFDYSTMEVWSNSSCEDRNGKILGLKVTGADRYEWKDDLGKVISDQLDVSNLPNGFYTLTAYNSKTGCQKQSRTSIIYKNDQFKILEYNTTQSSCSKPTGAINILKYAGETPREFKWHDANGKLVSKELNPTNLPAGTYRLSVINWSNCPYEVGDYTVDRKPLINIGTNSLLIVDDQCQLTTGAIKNLTISGGTPPFNYNWKNDKGETISTNLDLTNVPAGDYQLTISDQAACDATIVMTIPNGYESLNAPIVNNVTLCSPGTAIIMVRNTENGGTYKVYESPISSAPIAQSANGILTIGKVEHDQTYFVSFSKGSCESDRTAVKVSLTSDAVQVSNVFTPNGDGKNEVWEIGNMEQNPTAEINVFNRYGQIVFHSIGYHTPFDGTYKGQKLPVGTYYYSIHLKADCPAVVGPLTIIR
ncbi:gliding motility-associated C-terminal domain-containing protein [Solitalea sp. MAHUQ-68]|uniref:Gliding motility-associated C-terminal domain-containing protein n=1 Tax=Solitalea agri TaxID=2953739 RepID=A0A9X2FA76_9SPHI|nr:gliding motility-associated C-terminal domain-containing protein [Solitalea agri]MCO4293218.1 gliding motility-associated C-terminal domain-containing protein [Solitalea agri]